MSYINNVLHITTDDNRELTGKLLVFDRHMNIVLSDVVETRVVGGQGKKTAGGASSAVERKLGLVLLRGEHVVSLRADKATAATDSVVGTGLPKGTGTVKKHTAEKRPRAE
ncbi:small nuclear ribonucleoprotein protein, putative [Bodo saltans]|uniref:Sm protein B n=1 Tax=Bodo saltans TaxID=75058 RepID=A0A0S4J6U1_BODSA|nr:small nuclear ribonucleoprotein protein, putative [Bodo saltans]|eukprot:CUG85785.1 small nuclear ribonucleoprotein protein, putative [Bodo saltans]